MQLRELLAIENPTIEQFQETERVLGEILQTAKAEVEKIDAEHRSMAAARLSGDDLGELDRATRRSQYAATVSDAEQTLQAVRQRHAQLEARLEKEADEKAWKGVREILKGRRAVMDDIEAHCAEIGNLYAKLCDMNSNVRKATPVDLAKVGFHDVFGARPEQFGLLILTRLYSALDWPGRGQNYDTGYLSTIYGKALANSGLTGSLEASERAILSLE